MYILCTWVLRMVCTYHYGIFCCVLAWTGADILSMYIPVWTLPVHNGLILYHRIVHTYHMSSSYNVKTVYIHKHICISSYMYVHVHTCSDHVYTMYIHGMYNFMFLWACISRNTKWHRSRFEPMILCILTSCLDHYTTSVLVRMVIVALYVYCFTWRLVQTHFHSHTSSLITEVWSALNQLAKSSMYNVHTCIYMTCTVSCNVYTLYIRVCIYHYGMFLTSTLVV